MAAHRNWTEGEIQQAIDLYVQLPFGRIHSRNPQIIALASAIDRTPSSVALKLSNLASIDETLDRRGMANASDLDRRVWRRFFEQIKQIGQTLPLDPFESAINFVSDNPQAGYSASPNAGKTVLAITSVRMGQDFFRRMVMASYDNKCGITSIAQPELLVAGHIRPWSSDADNRMNPKNGICLNRLHDKAFEEKLIAIDEDCRVLYSRRLKSDTKQKLINLGGNGHLSMPSRFKPDPDFLREHRDRFWFLEKAA